MTYEVRTNDNPAVTETQTVLSVHDTYEDAVDAVEREERALLEAMRERGEWSPGSPTTPYLSRIIVERPELVGVSEVARISGISAASVRTYVKRGTIPDPVPVAGSEALVWERSMIERWAEVRPGRGRPRS